MNPDTASHPQDFKTPNAAKVVKVTRHELPVHCPREGESLWNSHPRVYIPVEENGGRAICIYCGTVYELVD
ncbi:MAG: zinc-finger domain-containing protein [Gammaproteobacteria bacterium]|nr:zinc-finger domain-containing protein [Gammaproteobacteria bacterium]